MPSTGTPSASSSAFSFGASSANTLAGPPERMMALGASLRTRASSTHGRHDLAVDVQLADPPGDELGELRAVVDDDYALRAAFGRHLLSSQ